MKLRGTAPPTTLSTNSNPEPSGSGCTSMSHTAYCPCPPDCLTCLPWPFALPPNVSRSGTRSSTVSTATPYRRDSASSTTPEWASPMHHNTIWWVSGFCSMRSVGSSAASRCNPTDSLSSSVLARGCTAIGSSGSGIVHGLSTSGSDLSDSVSPVSARLSRPMAQMSPATTDGAGRCCLPSGNDSVPMRSSSSWSAWLVDGTVMRPEGTEKRREMARHVHRRVGPDRPGEHPDQADPADIGIRRRLHHLGQQGSVRVAGQAVAGRALRGENLGQLMLGRRGKPAGGDLEQFERADAGAAAHRDHREERPPGDGLLQVVDQHRLVDLLATEVALHQRLVLGLLDDSLDQGAAQFLDRLGVRRVGLMGVVRLPSAYS